LPIYGTIIAFEDFDPIKGIFGSKIIGFKNFNFFFTSLDWLKVTYNTIFLNLLFIVTGTVAQIALAIIVSEISNKHLKRVSQSLTILPYFLSWPVVAMFSVAFMQTDGGLINSVLNSLGMKSIQFYTDPGIWPLILVYLRLWKNTGYFMIIYIAAITGMDQEMYESAKIDGASKMQSIIYVTIPGLLDTAIMLFLISIGSIFYGDFGMIYALIGDNSLLYPTTDVIDTFVFRAMRDYGNMSMSAAVGLYQSIVGCIIVFSSNALTRKLNKDAALF
jgi:putative aldouronate transport system permease protein